MLRVTLQLQFRYLRPMNLRLRTAMTFLNFGILENWFLFYLKENWKTQYFFSFERIRFDHLTLHNCIILQRLQSLNKLNVFEIKTRVYMRNMISFTYSVNEISNRPNCNSRIKKKKTCATIIFVLVHFDRLIRTPECKCTFLNDSQTNCERATNKSQ